MIMGDQHFTTAFLVDKTPDEIFNAINNVRGWWKADIAGDSSRLDDEFVARFGDVHYSRHKLVEVVPDQKVVWLTVDAALTFVEDKGEWIGTTISFEILPKDGQYEVRFTQQGLTPQLECYNACSNAWMGYVQDSLRELIVTGKGLPTA
jgi:hypothetical protein